MEDKIDRAIKTTVLRRKLNTIEKERFLSSKEIKDDGFQIVKEPKDKTFTFVSSTLEIVILLPLIPIIIPTLIIGLYRFIRDGLINKNNIMNIKARYLHPVNKERIKHRRHKYFFLIFLILYFVFSFSIDAQVTKTFNNSISLIVSPAEESGIGLKYSFHKKNFGSYLAISRGSYKLPDTGYLEDHIKLSGGYSRLVTLSRMSGTFNLYSIGLSYHLYGQTFYKTMQMSKSELFPVSFEIGAGAGIGRLSGMFRFDPLKWECSIDFGISF
jgi:hypothetical protein